MLYTHARTRTRAGWLGAASMITSIILGLGVLGLPLAFSRLGWVLGVAAVALGAAGAVYSGLLIGRVVESVTRLQRGERPKTYASLARACFGMKGSRVVRLIQHVFLGGALVAVQMTAAKALVQVLAFSGVSFCLVSSHAVIVAVMFPVMQIRQLSEATVIAVLGVVVIVIALILYLAELPQHPYHHHHSRQNSSSDGSSSNGSSAATTSGGFPKATSDGFKAAQAVTTILFAYQGQTIFPEVISEMRRPQDFTKSVYSSVSVMTFIYILVAAVGYKALGAEHAEYLQKWADENRTTETATTVANFMLAVHVLTGYAINGNVFNTTLLGLMVPANKQGSRLAWAAVATVTLSGSFVVANLVPGLDGLLSLVGSVCGTSLTFLIPAGLALKLNKMRMLKMGPAERTLHCTIIGLALLLLFFGSYSAGVGLRADFNDTSRAFSCGSSGGGGSSKNRTVFNTPNKQTSGL